MIPASASPIQTNNFFNQGKLTAPWPEQIRGVSTEGMDWDTYQLLEMYSGYERMDNRGKMFEGETIVITGASSGIGEKMAVLFAELGGTVINIDRDPSYFQEEDGPGSIKTFQHTFGASNKSTRDLVEQIAEQHGIQKLFLNAGIFPAKERPDPQARLSDAQIEAYEKTVKINGVAAGVVYNSASRFLRAKANAGQNIFTGITGSKNLSESSHSFYAEAMALRAQILQVITTDNDKIWQQAKKDGTLDEFVNVSAVVISPDANFDTNAYGRNAEERREKIKSTADAAGLSVENYVADSNPAGADYTSWTTARQFLIEASPLAIGRNNRIIKVDGDKTGI